MAKKVKRQTTTEVILGDGVDVSKVQYAGIVVDMQERFASYFNNAVWDKLVQNQSKILNFLRRYDLPVVLVGYRRFGEFSDDLKASAAYAKNWDHIRRDVSLNVDYSDNAFNNTRLSDTLLQWDVNHLIMMGVQGSACVRKTAQGALERGFQVSSAQDLLEDSADMERESDDYRVWFPQHCIYFPKHSGALIEQLQKDLEVCNC